MFDSKITKQRKKLYLADKRENGKKRVSEKKCSHHFFFFLKKIKQPNSVEY
jgi:hypothetical protein